MNKEELENAFNETTDNAVNLLKENVELKKRIDKVIDYIQEHLYMESTEGIQHPTFDGKMNRDTDGFELLNILKGDDKN